MGFRELLGRWPVVRQLRRGDRFALGAAAYSERTRALVPRTREADKVVKSVCPYRAVGCGQRIFVREGEVTQIEGDPDSPSWPTPAAATAPEPAAARRPRAAATALHVRLWAFGLLDHSS